MANVADEVHDLSLDLVVTAIAGRRIEPLGLQRDPERNIELRGTDHSPSRADARMADEAKARAEGAARMARVTRGARSEVAEARERKERATEVAERDMINRE